MINITVVSCYCNTSNYFMLLWLYPVNLFSDILSLLNHNLSYRLRTTPNTGTLAVLSGGNCYVYYVFSIFSTYFGISSDFHFCLKLYFKQISSYLSTLLFLSYSEKRNKKQKTKLISVGLTVYMIFMSYLFSQHSLAH